MKLFYCSAGGHLWYYEKGVAMFYKSVNDATDAEIELAEEKYCGCND